MSHLRIVPEPGVPSLLIEGKKNWYHAAETEECIATQWSSFAFQVEDRTYVRLGAAWRGRFEQFSIPIEDIDGVISVLTQGKMDAERGFGDE